MKRDISIITFALLIVGVIFAVFIILNYTPESEVVDTDESFVEAAEEEAETGFEITSEIILPEFNIETVVSDLSNVWDIGFLPNGELIFTERGYGFSIFENGLIKSTFQIEDAYIRGEGGILGLAVDPNFTSTKYVYICFNSTLGSNPEVRVARFQLNSDLTDIVNRNDIVTGIPSVNSGRHSGCQLEFGTDGFLWIGTGDAATGTVPQDPQSLGGKILRVDRDGNPVDGNLSGEFDPRIFSLGHRNVQGLAFFPEDLGFNILGVSVEQGPSIDDEVSPLVSGNSGWNPIPGYNEQVPMTNTQAYQNTISPILSTGNRTFAMSGGTILFGEQWGDLQGTIVVASLKDQKLTFIKVDKDGNLLNHLNAFEGQFGRLRTAQLGLDGSLYILTDKGSSDSIIRITPK